MDRYEKALADSKVTGDDSVVAAEVKKILESAGDYATPEVYQFLFSSIDLTTLSTEDSQESPLRFDSSRRTEPPKPFTSISINPTTWERHGNLGICIFLRE